MKNPIFTGFVALCRRVCETQILFGLFVLKKRYLIIKISGYCIVVVPLPSKQEVRVRFPLSAPNSKIFKWRVQPSGKAVDCDSTIRGFKPRRSPLACTGVERFSSLSLRGQRPLSAREEKRSAYSSTYTSSVSLMVMSL